VRFAVVQQDSLVVVLSTKARMFMLIVMILTGATALIATLVGTVLISKRPTLDLCALAFQVTLETSVKMIPTDVKRQLVRAEVIVPIMKLQRKALHARVTMGSVEMNVKVIAMDVWRLNAPSMVLVPTTRPQTLALLVRAKPVMMEMSVRTTRTVVWTPTATRKEPVQTLKRQRLGLFALAFRDTMEQSAAKMKMVAQRRRARLSVTVPTLKRQTLGSAAPATMGLPVMSVRRLLNAGMVPSAMINQAVLATMATLVVAILIVIPVNTQSVLQ
jgi:hypothetical protein